MTDFKRAVKAMGFHADREGLITRYLNESKAWEIHIQKTKSFILKSAESKIKGTCAVLGSGWCLDVPVYELAELFSELILVDISHPRQIKNKYKKYGNIHFYETDITCVTEAVYAFYKKKKRSLSDVRVSDDCNFGLPQSIEADMYVSPNVLSQLGGLINEFLMRKTKAGEDERLRLSKQIEEAHLNMLPENKSCLIVDYAEIISKQQQIVENQRVLLELPESEQTDEWLWEFDLSGNYIPNAQVSFRVRAFDF